MTSARERLLAKQRRRTVVPVQVSDPGRDEEAAAIARVAAVVNEDEGQQERLDAAAAAAQAAVDEHTLLVELQSIPPVDWELITTTYPGANPAEDYGIDWRRALPVLLAACAVDEDLRDVDLWEGLLADDAWSHGDSLQLWAAVLRVNTRAPAGRTPKG